MVLLVHHQKYFLKFIFASFLFSTTKNEKCSFYSLAEQREKIGYTIKIKNNERCRNQKENNKILEKKICPTFLAVVPLIY